MGSSLRFVDGYRAAFAKNSGWFLIWGILLTVLGLAAISASTFTTLITVVALGFLLFISGCIMLLDTFTFWRGKSGSFLVHLIFALLYIAVGVILMNNPVEGSVSITFIIGIFYLIAGIFRLVFNTMIKMPRWGWGFFNGIISIMLGVLILANWPASSVFIIGLFVGIDLFFAGMFYIMASLAARSLR